MDLARIWIQEVQCVATCYKVTWSGVALCTNRKRCTAANELHWKGRNLIGLFKIWWAEGTSSHLQKFLWRGLLFLNCLLSLGSSGSRCETGTPGASRFKGTGEPLKRQRQSPSFYVKNVQSKSAVFLIKPDFSHSCPQIFFSSEGLLRQFCQVFICSFCNCCLGVLQCFFTVTLLNWNKNSASQSHLSPCLNNAAFKYQENTATDSCLLVGVGWGLEGVGDGGGHTSF